MIGGGVAGLSAAWRLSTDRHVVLLEAEDHCGTHSTGRSAATLTENYGPPAVRALTAASRAFLEHPPDGFAPHPLVRPRGSLFIAPAGDLAELQSQLALARRHTSTITPIDPADALRMVPVLRPETVAGAFYEPDCRDIDVDLLVRGYRRGLLRQGGTIVTAARATRIERGPAWVVHTPAGRFSAPTLVNAAGAWADQVAALAGVRPIGLQPKRRTVVMLPAPGAAAWPMVNDIAEHLYFKPDAGQLMVSPADATPSPPCDAQPEEWDVAVALDRLQAMTSLDISRIGRRWAGLRSFAADHAPVVGEAPDAPGFYWLAGQGGFGVMTSPALSAALAAAVRGAPVPAAIGPARLQP